MWKPRCLSSERRNTIGSALINCFTCVYTGIEAIKNINEAIDKGDVDETLAALQLPSAKLSNIDPLQAVHYQVLLAKEKDNKAEVRVWQR